MTVTRGRGPVRSGPSRGTKVSREEIEAFKEKTRQAEKAGIYLSEKQRAALNRSAASAESGHGETGAASTASADGEDGADEGPVTS